MSDDLIKRLLDYDHIDAWQAAARIEELEESNKELTLQLLAVHGQAADVLDRAVVAEAKLDRTVAALDYYAKGLRSAGLARAALAELEGEGMTCPPCTHNCNEGRDCPAKKK